MGVGAAIAGALKLTGFWAAAAGVAIEAAIAVGANMLSQQLQNRPSAGSRPGRAGNVRSATMGHQVIYGETRKGGLIAYANGSGPDDNNKYLYLVIVFCAHEVEEFGDFYVNGELITVDPVTHNANGRFKDYAFFEFMSGADTQEANANLIAEVADATNWGTSHRLQGRAYVYAKLRESPARFPSFIPTLTCKIKGRNDIYDPRDGTLKWTDNPALIAAHILEEYVKVPRSRIDEATLIASANDCDTTVTKVGGTEKKYRANGFIDLEGEPEDWLDPIVRAMAGAVVEHDGTYYVHSGYYIAPEVTITDSHLVGDIVRTTARSSLDRANVIKGIFVAPETYEAPTEYPIIRDAAPESGHVVFLEDEQELWQEDGTPVLEETRAESSEVVMEHDLEFVGSHTQAQRVAKIILQTQLLDETITCDVSLIVGLDVKPWDAVTLNSDALGVNGIYKVIGHSFNLTEGPRAYVSLTLRKHAASLYDWDPATEEQEFAPAAGPVVNEGAHVKWTAGEGSPDASVDGDPGDRFVDKNSGEVWIRKRGAWSGS